MNITLLTLCIVDNDSLNPIPSLYLPSSLDVFIIQNIATRLVFQVEATHIIGILYTRQDKTNSFFYRETQINYGI